MSRTDDLREIEDARDSLYSLLRSVPRGRLTPRPDSGEWSVLENVRHLLYAEEKHLLLKLAPRSTWTPIGLPTKGIVRRGGAGSEFTDDLDEVLAAWDATHERVRAALHAASPDGKTERALDRNLGHLRAHIRTIRRLLDAPEA